jgi:UDP-3-O-[3-hydroxymyristoyl] glucosamine N-acyltransferase
VSPSAAEVARFLKEIGQLETLATAVGDDPEGILLTGVSSHVQARPGDLAWSRAAEGAAFRGGLLICPAPPPASTELAKGSAVAACVAPRLAMAQVLGRFFAELSVDREPVYADPGLAAMVAANLSWVKNATVGPGVTIAQHVAIGCGGMGYERDADGRLAAFPQLGGVVLEADVDVGAHATIQRGALGDTVIHRGAKIGPHVNVGHGAEIGEDVLVAGHAQIGGGSHIGRGTVVWQSAVIANRVTIGDGAVVGMAAAVRKDVGAGEVWAGNPARRLR